jgi:hypothetical protein
MYADWRDWAKMLLQVLAQQESAILRVVSTRMPPAAKNPGMIVLVTDLAVLKASNGTIWKTITWT